jgi:hypothetical protein
MADWREIARQMKFQESKSWNDIATELRFYFPELDQKQIIEKVRGFLRNQPEYKVINPIKEKTEVAGIIGDLHFPFAHQNYIRFLEDTFEKYGVTRVIQIGDLVDNHAISRWQSESDSYGAITEFEMAQKDIEIYKRVFPQMDITNGNHDLIPVRQAASLGIPQQYMKGFHELWNLPKGWTVQEQLILNDVLYEHGTGCSGKNAAIDKATNSMMSCCIGHLHGFAGVQYKSNSKMLIFGMNVGCGVSVSKYAFRYGKYNKNRETLACGIVFDSANGIVVPMSEKYFHEK